MTALNFVLSESACVLAMDSLALTTGGDHFKFCTKFFPLPHLQTVICTTGVQQMGNQWVVHINERIIANDLIVIERCAQEELTRIADYVCLEETGGTATIYHFGYSPKEARVIGFACRSTNGFAPERLEYGVHVKPLVGVEDLVIAQMEAVNRGEKTLPEAFSNLMIQQKAVDESGEAERVGIGGEIYLVQIAEGLLTVQTIYQFPDFASNFKDMLHHLTHNIGGTLL